MRLRGKINRWTRYYSFKKIKVGRAYISIFIIKEYGMDVVGGGGHLLETFQTEVINFLNTKKRNGLENTKSRIKDNSPTLQTNGAYNLEVFSNQVTKLHLRLCDSCTITTCRVYKIPIVEKIRFIKGHAKCRHLKKLTCIGRCLSIRIIYPSPLTHCMRVYYTVYLVTQRRGGGVR